MKEWIDTKLDGVRSYYIYPRRVALVYALVIFLVLLLAWLQAGRFIEGRLANAERDQISARVNTVGTSLTLAVNQRLNLITSVRSFIEAEVHSDIDFSFSDPDESDEVNKFATGLYESVAGIRNIAIAPNGVMEYVYPYEENKTVLGYEPIQDERLYVRDEVRRAVQTGEIVLSLPYELIQGGQGLIARQAIYVEDGYWGLANLVLDMPPVLEDAGVAPVPSGLDLGLKDQSGKLFFGSEDVFLSNPVTYTVILPEGDWELAGVPNVGWGSSYRMTLRAYRIMGLITIAAISLVTYQLVNRRDRLADLVDRRTQELNLSNQTLLTVLEGINADVYVADFDTFEILFANKHIRDSFNDDLVGKICYQVFRNEDSICAHCQNDNLLVANVPPTETIVWEDRNPITGRWYKNADRAIRWHDGRYVHLQIATDFTEQKEAKGKLEGLLKEKDILLAEVHHRVKNNMQIIVSLLGLQASEIEDEHMQVVYQESLNRINSMALVHEQLYQSREYAHIDFETYIDQLVTTLFNTYQIDPDRIQFRIEGENICLDLERAIPCGLMLNELITNSLKYAFPDNCNGELWIEFQRDEEKISLTFKDDGIGLPAEFELENTQSLGLQLVQLLAVHDLKGKFEIRNDHKRGAEYLIEFPLNRVKNDA